MTDDNVLQKRPYRLPAWVSLMVFSIVVLAAMSSRGFDSSAEKYVIALSSISLTFSLVAIVAYLVPTMRHAFIGELAEVVVAIFLLVLWISGIPVIMSPSKTIAIAVAEGLTFVSNANLYFFSWAAFFCIVFICGSLLTENVVGAQEALSSISSNSKLGKWFMLLVTSLIVMASASQFQSAECGDGVDSDTCTSNKYAISLGVIAFVFAFIISLLTYMNSLNIYVETGTALLLFVMYTAGVGVITFNFGSGVTIGNLVSTYFSFSWHWRLSTVTYASRVILMFQYFSTWGGFMIAIFLLTECYQGVAEQSAVHHESTLDKQESSGIQVEPIPEEEDI